jgi:hypothetical protein
MKILVLGICACIPNLTFAVDAKPLQQGTKPVSAENSDTSLDLRVSLGGVPGVEKVKADNTTSKFDDTAGGRLGVELVWTNRDKEGMGFFYGPGLYSVGHAAEETTQFGSSYSEKTEVTLGALAAGGQIGAAYAPNDWYQLDLGVRGLIGISRTREEVTETMSGIAVTDTNDSQRGSYWDTDLFIANRFIIHKHFELGLELGYSVWQAKNTMDYGVSKSDLTLSGNGLELALSVGVRF